MSFQPELEKVYEKIIQQLQSNEANLSVKQKQIIKDALLESYDTGYEEGLADGEEITENPISG